MKTLKQSILVLFIVYTLPSSAVTDISMGWYHSCALKNDGRVYCWGLNDEGQLGNGSTTDSNIPIQVSSLDKIQVISANWVHSCALKNDGSAYCWGPNTGGELGNGSNTSSNIPVKVSNLSEIQAISTGMNHSCALKNDGSVYCWGYNELGQLGNGSTTNSNIPIKVSNLNEIRAISTGEFHSCALKNDGNIYCWGFNGFGQLGNGSNTDSNIPVKVSNLSKIQAISAGFSYACALKNDGNVYCWGDWGGGSTTGSTTPIKISSLSKIRAISASAQHCCALKNDGNVYCWGLNDEGQLGNGSNTNTDSSTPVKVSNLSKIQAISTGGYHSCALRNDGSVYCWGLNENGELGNGSNTNSNIPVKVLLEEYNCCSYEVDGTTFCDASLGSYTFKECKALAKNAGAKKFKWGQVNKATAQACWVGGGTCGDVQEYLKVTLDNLTTSISENQLVIQWDTASEENNLGMNLWCAQMQGNQFEEITQLNSELIPSKAILPNYGTSYSSTDYPYINTNLQPGIQPFGPRTIPPVFH